MITLSHALSHLLPQPRYFGVLEETEASYDKLVWADDRPKPLFKDLENYRVACDSMHTIAHEENIKKGIVSKYLLQAALDLATKAHDTPAIEYISQEISKNNT